MKKHALLTLALLASPALAVASPKPSPFRVTAISRSRLVMENVYGRRLVITRPCGASALHVGEVVFARVAASREVQVNQTPPPRIFTNRLRVVQSLPLRVTLETMTAPHVLATFHTSIRTAMALHPGEIVRLKIVPVRP